MADTLYNICFLKKFNNYFNRKIIGYENLADYTSAAEEFFIPDHTVSFDPRDNVSTEIIMNDCPFDADYCLILDLENNILSRWFVVEVVFIRRGQKTYKLRRDVIYDNLNELMLAPVYVQKGWLKDSDPFIFNSEGMSYNEIKKDEYLLKDNTKASYIVGYIAKNAAATEISLQVDAEVKDNYITLENIASDLGVSISTLNSLLNYNNARDNPAYFVNKVEIRFGTSSNDVIPFVWKNRFFFNSGFSELISKVSEQVTSWTKTLYKYKTSIFNNNRFSVFDNADNAIANGIISNKASVISGMSSIFSRPYLTEEQLTKLQKYNGKFIKYNSLYYQLQIDSSGVSEEVEGPAIYTSFSGISSGINSGASTSQFTNNATLHDDGEISVRATGTLVYINLNDETLNDTIPAVSTKIPTTRNHNKNNNFDLFVIPYESAKIKYGSAQFETLPITAQRIASEIAKQLDSACYDVQLLPYFPIPDIVESDGKITLNNLVEDVDYTKINQIYTGEIYSGNFKGEQFEGIMAKPGTVVIGGVSTPCFFYDLPIFDFPYIVDSGSDQTTNLDVISGGSYFYNVEFIFPTNPETQATIRVISLDNTFKDHLNEVEFDLSYEVEDALVLSNIIFWPKSDSFTAFLNKNLELKDSMKVESECNKYRICSPNYQGSFDFNVARNGGSVNYFIADCTYKPYTPYIKVAPEFKNLYGTNYGDARGLICSGDFSLSRFTSAWESFELQNKNYQNIFNREIQKLDFEQSLEYRKSLISGGIGILTGGVGGAAAGGMASGSWIGAVVGGVAGTAGSAAGLGLDIDMLVKQQRENRQFAIDKFNYQLGNIKALPYTLTKIGAFNINSKIWPFLEYYTCTDEEKEALQNKLKYESMTVMRIGYFGDFWRIDSELKYFKGELIRNEEIAEDTHIFEAIYGEILKGVYM